MANIAPDSICQECQQIITGYWKRDPTPPSNKYFTLDKYGRKTEVRHHNLSQLEECAGNGCPMCILIRRELDRWNKTEDLLRLRDIDLSGAEILLVTHEREHDTSGPWEGDISIRLTYTNLYIHERRWCFMHISRASSGEGIYSEKLCNEIYI